MQYIFENFGYICCAGEVSALDGENIDVFKNSQIDVTPNYLPSSYNSSFSQLVPALVPKFNSDYIKRILAMISYSLSLVSHY